MYSLIYAYNHPLILVRSSFMNKEHKSPEGCLLYRLQYLLLWLFYYNMEEVIGYYVKLADSQNGSVVLYYMNFYSFGSSTITLDKFNNGTYRINLSVKTEITAPPKTYTVDLGKGKHLVNRRVKNELGVILSPFLDKVKIENYQKFLFKEVETRLQKLRETRPTLGDRLTGKVQTLYSKEDFCSPPLIGYVVRKDNLFGDPSFSTFAKIKLGGVEHFLEEKY